MWYASTFNTCVFCFDCAVENRRYTYAPLNSCSLTVALSVPSPLLHNFSTQPGLHTPATPPWRPRTAYARGCGAEAAARVGAWASLGCTQCKAAGDWPSSEGKGTYSLSSGGWGCAPGSRVKDLRAANPCWTACTPAEVKSLQRLQQEVCWVYDVHFLQSLRLPKLCTNFYNAARWNLLFHLLLHMLLLNIPMIHQAIGESDKAHTEPTINVQLKPDVGRSSFLKQEMDMLLLLQPPDLN